MTLKCAFVSVLPLLVSITSEQTALSADRVYDIHCLTFGSRPKALVTWWLGLDQLLDHNSTVSDVFLSCPMTCSIFQFVIVPAPLTAAT